MNVQVVRSRCCGSGFCVELAPDVFALDSKQRAIVLDADGATREILHEAAEACPCDAIVVEEDALEAPAPGRRQVPSESPEAAHTGTVGDQEGRVASSASDDDALDETGTDAFGSDSEPEDGESGVLEQMP